MGKGSIDSVTAGQPQQFIAVDDQVDDLLTRLREKDRIIEEKDRIIEEMRGDPLNAAAHRCKDGDGAIFIMSFFPSFFWLFRNVSNRGGEGSDLHSYGFAVVSMIVSFLEIPEDQSDSL